MKKTISVFAAGVLLAWAVSAQAVFLDAYDNALAPDGLYAIAYQNIFVTKAFNDSKGNKAADIDYSSYQTTVRAAYYKTVAGVPIVLQVGIPVGSVTEKKSGEKSSGLGDIWGGPGVFLYKDDTSKTYLSNWVYFFAPTGDFDKNHSWANQGLNHWYFQEQVAFSKTWDKVVLDANLNYYIHTKEKDKKIETPDRLETEISLGYQATDKLLVGLDFGGHWDLADYKIAGVTQSDTAAERYEVGPILAYNFTDKFGATVRWNHDISSKNDFKADSVWLRASYAF